jgi:FkbM family methyltransferase
VTTPTLRVYPPESDGVRSGLDVVLRGSYDVPGLTFEKPPTILDIGGHVGSATVRFAHIYPGATIHTYEPSPENASFARTNVEGLATLHEVAVVGPGHPEVLTLHEGKSNTGQRSIYVLGEQQAVGVQVKTMIASDLPPCNILKIDSEGCELEVLRSYKHLAGVKALLLEWHSLADYQELLRWIPTLGFDLVRDDAKGQWIADRNLIFVRPEAAKNTGGWTCPYPAEDCAVGACPDHHGGKDEGGPFYPLSLTREKAIASCFAQYQAEKYLVTVITERKSRGVGDPRQLMGACEQYLHEHGMNTDSLGAYPERGKRVDLIEPQGQGLFRCPRSSLDMIAGLYGEYDLGSMPNLTAPIVNDVGGHVGGFAWYALKRWPDARVTSFEPHPETFALLKGNVAGLPVDARHAAVVHPRSTPTMRLYEGRSGRHECSLRDDVLWPRAAGDPNPACSQLLDKWIDVPTFDAAELGPCDVMKVDCEGSEIEILSGYRHLGGVRVLCVEPHAVGGDIESQKAQIRRIAMNAGLTEMGGHILRFVRR